MQRRLWTGTEVISRADLDSLKEKERKQVVENNLARQEHEK